MKILTSKKQEEIKQKFIKMHEEIARECLWGHLEDIRTFECIEDRLMDIEYMILSLNDISNILDSNKNYYDEIIEDYRKMQTKNKKEVKEDE